ncbi:Qa-SNARE, syp8/Ufe1p/Syntaxin 18-type [Dinochytrium kinnereticum]|nr:Qa-SNARE, syp8/Ufe1p/Syntaxin 18-type [Dinochytrium kinnereticum]
MLEHKRSIIWLLQIKLVRASEELKGMQKTWLDMRMARQLRYESKPTKKETKPSTRDESSTGSLSGIVDSAITSTGAAKLIASVGRVAAGAVAAATSSLSGSASSLRQSDSEKSTETKISLETKSPGGWEDGWDSDGEEKAEERPSRPLDNSYQEEKSMAKSTSAQSSWQDLEKERIDEEMVAVFPEKQRMLLEKEHDLLVAEFQSGLEQVRTATQSLQEISSLHGQLAFHLQEQEKTIQRLHEEAVVATQNVESGNVYLNKAYKNFGDSRLWLIVFFAVSTASLLFLDWFYS